MSKLTRPRLPQPPKSFGNVREAPDAIAEYLNRLIQSTTEEMDRTRRQINQLSEGRKVAHYNSVSATPVAQVQCAVGDVILNNSAVEAGSAGSRYVVIGYRCVSAGTPGDFVELRCLTGN